LNADAQAIVQHGYVWLFVFALLERLGLPLLVTPIMVAAGAVCGLGQLNLFGIIAVTVFAAELGDAAWYELGRARGSAVLRLLCRITLEPDSCVRKSEDRFSRHTVNALFYSKFLPGVGRLVAPIAGMSKMPRGRFLWLNAAGTALWAVTFALLGYIPAKKLPIDVLLEEAAGTILALLVAALVINVVYKFWQRRKFIESLRIVRLTPHELKASMDRGDQPFIVDLRHELEFLVDPRTVPTAVRIGPTELPARKAEIPRDRDIVLYCTCPSEATSAKVALQLKEMGITRVRPLQGGLQGWEEAGFAVAEFFPEEEKLATER
jgi:membrane protein DedA with SNARE-associated domain/rhodanese-related sulfurtransferase